ncbi:MAG: T9SS type A sorting domain-containing protein [Bacteroidales bacterium]|nr:T9SS type A sorting domain-containing protein [Bacteroidales bacterium]
MKKLTLFLLALVYSALLNAQDTIPNAGFENWYSSTLPYHWNTTNQFLPPGVFTVSRFDTAAAGNYAMKLETINLDDMLIPGVSTLGGIELGYTYGGIPFTGRPVKLKGFVKHPSSGDEVLIFAEFRKEGELIGQAFWSTTDSLGSFTSFEVYTSWMSPADPDTMNITIVTDSFFKGSMLLVDELSFEYLPTSTTEIDDDLFIAYPNPVIDKLCINSPAPVKSISVCDLQGRSLFFKRPTDDFDFIHFGAFPGGTYFIRVETNNGLYSRTIIKH